MNRINRFLAVFLAAILIMYLVPITQAKAEHRLFAMVSGTSSLNVRSGPGTGYSWLGRVKGGGWVEVLENYGDWYLVNVLAQSLTGYVSSRYLKTAGGSGAGGTAIVNNPVPGQFLNLRQYPSLTAPVLGIYYNGAVASVLSESGGWYYVQIEGKLGYFRGEYLLFAGGSGSSKAGSVYSANGGSVNLRSGPGYGFSVLGQYRPGTSVSVHLQGDPFWYITVGSRSGFMDKKFLRLGSGGGDGGGGAAGTGIVTHTGRRLNLREQPSTSARVIGQYAGGTELIIDSQGVDWCRVTVPSTGAKGYMMSRYLTLYGVPGVSTRRVVHPDATFVNLRTQPSQASGAVIVRVPHGSIVNVVAPDGAWTKVRYNTYTGFMMSYFLK